MPSTGPPCPKAGQIIPILFSADEIAQLQRLCLQELERIGCAADPAVTSALFRLVEAQNRQPHEGDNHG